MDEEKKNAQTSLAGGKISTEENLKRRVEKTELKKKYRKITIALIAVIVIAVILFITKSCSDSKENTEAIKTANHVTIMELPADVTVANGETATVSVRAAGDGLTYKWYFRNAGDSDFYLTDSYTGNTYSVIMDADRSGRQVYCKISDKYGNTVTTNTVTLKMPSPVTITKQPTDVTVEKGKTATVSVSAAGDGLTYKWYFKNAGDSEFYMTDSYMGNTYSVVMDADRSGRQVYCKISDKYGNTVTTKTVTLIGR